MQGETPGQLSDFGQWDTLMAEWITHPPLIPEVLGSISGKEEFISQIILDTLTITFTQYYRAVVSEISGNLPSSVVNSSSVQ